MILYFENHFYIFYCNIRLFTTTILTEEFKRILKNRYLNFNKKRLHASILFYVHKKLFLSLT